MKRKNIVTLILFLVGCFSSYSYADFNYRPEYAQSSNLAYTNSLGYSSIMMPYQTSSIMQGSSFLFNNPTDVIVGGYSRTQYGSHSLDLAYVYTSNNTDITFGFEYIMNLIGADTYLNNDYFTGRTNAFGFEQVIAAAAAYSFGETGTFGINMKIPINSYNTGIIDGGFLLAADYHISFFGFNFMAGLANIGAMYVNKEALGVYPDVQAGISYGYKDYRGESVFDIGFSLENNLGELINRSLVIGLGGRIRLFSSGLLKTKPLIQDDILTHRDNRQVEKTVQETLAALSTTIYLNLGFQFATESHFSIGASAIIDDYIVDFSFIFPSALTTKFGIYVSAGSLL